MNENEIVSLLPLVGQLVAEGLKLAENAYTASKEEAAALEDRLQASLTALRGEKTAAHAEADAQMKALQAELAALNAATVLVSP